MKWSLLLLLVSAEYALSARILCLFPIPARSHYNLLHAIIKVLVGRGHEVVNYSTLPLNDQTFANYTNIHLDNIETTESMTYDVLMQLVNASPIKAMTHLWSLPASFGEQTLQNENVKKLLDSDEKFDLIILEPTFAQEVLLGFAHKFKAPVILVQPFGAFSLINRVAGNSLNLAYIPDYTFPWSDQLSFYERILNAYSILGTLYTYYHGYLPTQDEHMKAVFKDPTMPPLVDLLHNISLFVNNAHPTIHYAQPYTPNILPIGGIHLAKERKPLPTEMAKFVDNAKNGVIFFSIGSIVPDHHLPKSYFNNFLSVFRRLPQRILWKTGSNISDLPNNVMTANWVPQQDILAHPNTVLFITHGGLFSQHEAISAGVPVVCIPFFGDQPLNARFYEYREIGVKLPLHTLSEETIYSKLTTVLNNPKYKENMQRMSKVYRDRPMAPSDSLVFWVEYILRHGGAPHLRPASSLMPFYKLYLLDVLAVMLAVFTVCLVVLYLAVKTVLRWFQSRRNASDSKKKN